MVNMILNNKLQKLVTLLFWIWTAYIVLSLAEPVGVSIGKAQIQQQQTQAQYEMQQDCIEGNQR
jgi:hypothetical protein